MNDGWTPVPPRPEVPKPPQRGIARFVREHTTWTVLTIAVLAALIGGAVSSSHPKTAAQPTTSPTPTFYVPSYSPPPVVETTPPPAPPKPEGRYGVASCDTASTNYHDLIGSTRVVNTGDVAFTATVTFVWHNGDGSVVKATPKQVSLQPGASKLVFFVKNVGGVDGQLNFQDNPDYFHGNKACTSKATFN